MPKKKIDIKPGDLVISCNPTYYKSCYIGYVVERFKEETPHWVIEWSDPKLALQVFHEDEVMRCKRYVEELQRTAV